MSGVTFQIMNERKIFIMERKNEKKERMNEKKQGNKETKKKERKKRNKEKETKRKKQRNKESKTERNKERKIKRKLSQTCCFLLLLDELLFVEISLKSFLDDSSKIVNFSLPSFLQQEQLK